MKRCSNLKNRVCRSSIAPRLMMRAVLLLLTAMLVLPGLGTASRAQSASNSLPEHVTDMRLSILEAAEVGTIEAMGEAIELNELTPEFGGAVEGETDPVRAFASLAPLESGVDPSTRDVESLFKTIAAVLALPHGREDGLFVWPALAVRKPGPLTEQERSDAEAILDAKAIAAMERGGPYSGLRIDIGGDGTWHFIGRSAAVVLSQ